MTKKKFCRIHASIDLLQPIPKSSIHGGGHPIVFKWKNPAISDHEICNVAVTQIEDYALALTVRDDTVD